MLSLRLTISLALILLNLPLLSAESPRTFPLWDGKESVASYAQRVNLPPTKTLDLGNGVTMDLVLIPAGQFIMGSEEPAKPTITVENANYLICFGGVAMVLLMIRLLFKSDKTRRWSFSLRWLLLLTLALGLFFGGIARQQLAIKEAARYSKEMADFEKLPNNEKPAHSVTLTQPFYMGKYTVTQEQYEALMGSNRSNFKGARLPVEMVSWDDATAFCAKLNVKLRNTAMKVGLPTEAQWEYACRAGTRTRFYTGDADSDLDDAGWSWSNSAGTTHPVGQKKYNAFGLYDMHGNVWEWCQDYWKAFYPSSNPTQDPTGPNDGVERILRGGSWLFDRSGCRSAARGFSPFHRNNGIGFRVVETILEN